MLRKSCFSWSRTGLYRHQSSNRLSYISLCTLCDLAYLGSDISNSLYNSLLKLGIVWSRKVKLHKSRFILHKWLMLYQLMLKIAKHQSLNLQEMSLLSYLYSQLSARQWWVFVFIGSADTLYLEKGANTAQLSKIEEWVIFYNWAWHDGL